MIEMPNSLLTAKGRLQVGVMANNIARPVENAVVRIMPRGERDNVLYELHTDISGQTPVVDLPAPPEEYSLEPTANKPYAEYDVDVDAAGYSALHISGVQILPDTLSYQDGTLNPSDVYGQTENIVIGEHALWGNYPPKIPEAEVKPLPFPSGLVVLPEPVVPEFIIVHMGVPTNNAAPRHWVPFKNYIKNVASSEIYATWPEQTLRANILAIISFTLNRVFTEWYRGQGKNFTITNSTQFDQAFIYGRNIFIEISRVVDDIFNTYITRPNIRQPLFAQYNDGRRTNNPGWLSQWGSKYLGDIGYSAINILKHYYGNDIYLTQAAIVAGVPESYPGTPLRLGSSGPDVRIIQAQLNRVSDNFPLIPKIRVDGVFGEATEEAVRTFQQIFRLTQDGVVGPATWYRISYIYVAVTGMAALS
jgi:hypothetical protein